ncbi:hypothetical protein PIB30_020655, partial [Stylosanthes scabra]|nr:hypothetical protein [Stylosanthes scabra]
KKKRKYDEKRKRKKKAYCLCLTQRTGVVLSILFLRLKGLIQDVTISSSGALKYINSILANHVCHRRFGSLRVALATREKFQTFSISGFEISF